MLNLGQFVKVELAGGTAIVKSDVRIGAVTDFALARDNEEVGTSQGGCRLSGEGGCPAQKRPALVPARVFFDTNVG
jgi:hypothetical protein